MMNRMYSPVSASSLRMASPVGTQVLLKLSLRTLAPRPCTPTVTLKLLLN